MHRQVDQPVTPPSSTPMSTPESPKTHGERLQEAIVHVQQAVQVDMDRTGQAHADFLEAVQQLNLLAETPREYLLRLWLELMRNPVLLDVPAG